MPNWSLATLAKKCGKTTSENGQNLKGKKFDEKNQKFDQNSLTDFKDFAELQKLLKCQLSTLLQIYPPLNLQVWYPE